MTSVSWEATVGVCSEGVLGYEVGRGVGRERESVWDSQKEITVLLKGML